MPKPDILIHLLDSNAYELYDSSMKTCIANHLEKPKHYINRIYYYLKRITKFLETHKDIPK